MSKENPFKKIVAIQEQNNFLFELMAFMRNLVSGFQTGTFPVMFDSFLAFKFLSVCGAENDSSLDAPLDFKSNDTLLSEIDVAKIHIVEVRRRIKAPRLPPEVVDSSFAVKDCEDFAKISSISN